MAVIDGFAEILQSILQTPYRIDEGFDADANVEHGGTQNVTSVVCLYKDVADLSTFVEPQAFHFTHTILDLL